MRIGIICYPTYGGSGVVASELGLALAARGHEIHVISFALPFRLQNYQERIFYHEVEVSQYPVFRYPPVTLSAACKIVEIAENHGLDILHVHYALPWAVCAHLAREVLAETQNKLKIITTLHGTDITLVGSEPAFFKMTRFGIQRSDAVTAVSEHLKEATLKTFGLQIPIEVIHNFVDSQRFQPRRSPDHCARRWLAPQGQKLVIHVSNFRKVKNTPDVVRAFALLRQKLPCRLVMVGEGPELPAARLLTRELKLEQDVLFLGTQQAVEEILPCADVFLLPSAFESFGLSALEGMSCGLPVVATEVGGLSEVVSSGVDGWLCQVGDCQCMAQRLYEILSDEQVRERMGQAARAKAIARFSPETIVTQYEQLYQRMMGGA